MAGRVPEHVVHQVIRGADFLRIVGRHCDLTRKGNSYWARCPFHEEKTPSFSIDPENGLYYCFGCKEGGNVFTFLEKMEGLSFGEALQRLAGEAGIDLSRYRTESGPSRDEIGALRAVNELATNFFQKCLQKKDDVREYLTHRHINADSIERWRLGYAPDGWQYLLELAAKRGFDAHTLVRAGLAAERERADGCYDRFRNRLMFPIADAAGRTIGFGARALREDDEPKYLNSPETPLFSKRNCFFGLSQARAAMRSSETAVVLEGYTDVIMAHQAGVENAVAVLGTALTQDHARRLGRLCERVVLLFDADEAGRKSALRSIEVLLGSDLHVLVATLPEGKDPCDYIVERGGEAFHERLEEARGFFDYRLEVAAAEHDLQTLEGRRAAFRDVIELALAVRDEAERDMIVRQTARELRVSESAAWAHVRRAWRGRGAGAQKPRADANERSLSADLAIPGELLGLLLLSPELLHRARETIREEDLGETPAGRALWRLLCAEREPTGVAEFVGSLPESALAEAAASAVAQERKRRERISAADPEERLRGYMIYLDNKRRTSSEAYRLASSAEKLDDEQLRAMHERLKEKDRKSAPR